MKVPFLDLTAAHEELHDEITEALESGRTKLPVHSRTGARCL